MNRRRNNICNFWLVLVLLIWWPAHTVFTQISPGDLAEVHAHLEGISNCTQCHSLGDKVTNEKCLDCHTELKTRIVQNKGYHASSRMKGRSCVSCHSDHHGRKFEIVRFKKEDFDHSLTGYDLTGAHARKTCGDCHTPSRIRDEKIRKKSFTYLGLSTLCIGCHQDYHQGTLPGTCTDCHGEEAFKPALKFDHARTKYPLTGSHQALACTSCHPVTSRNGSSFQEFAGIRHQSCASCHTDVHQNKFGQACSDCHTTESFHAVKGMTGFDHSRTGFPLENKHAVLTCSSCHKRSLTDPLKHEKCTDCHTDYHSGDFTVRGMVRSCADCHTTKGFPGSSFTVDDHDMAPFQLKGAHLATPCFVCHKKEDRWHFREIGSSCSDCHKDIHSPHITDTYYPGSSCESCHNESRWNNVQFDHSRTPFPLTGAHQAQSCRTCHFRTDDQGAEYQVFSELESRCVSCHEDQHHQQFDQNGVTDCLRCHNTVLWAIRDFDHNKTTRFKLEGKHAGIACTDCHKTVQKGVERFILYKIGDTSCEHCH